MNSAAIDIDDDYTVTDDTMEETNIEPLVKVKSEEVPYIQDSTNVETPIFIKTKFGSKTQPVQFTIIATGQTGNTSISGGKLRLIYGRIYFLPIDTDKSINSDDFANMKMFSDMSDKIDVRYINNQYAAIIPLQNNIMLSDDTRLCVLW